MSHQREGQATCWGYGHCSLRSTGDCGKWVKPLQSEQSLKGRTSLQGAVGSKGILVGFLFWYGFCLFVLNSYFYSVSLWGFSSVFSLLLRLWRSKPFGVLGSHGKGEVLQLPSELPLAGGPPQPFTRGKGGLIHRPFHFHSKAIGRSLRNKECQSF